MPVSHAMDATPLKFLRFSTDDFPEHKRIEAYREIFGRTIVKHDMEPVGDRPFRFESFMCGLPGLGLASSVVTPCRRWHGKQHIESDDLILGVGLAGGCVVDQRGREAVVGVGEAVLTSAADPADIMIASPSRPISLRIPYAVLRPRIANLDDRVSHRIPRDAQGLKLLISYVDAIRALDAPMRPELSSLAVAHIHDLVALIMGAEGDARERANQGGGRAARRLAVLREIERRSGDPQLSALNVAALLGVTSRYVHMLLEETGRSFSHHLLERRLEKAAALLRDPRWSGRRIADIAAEAGFTDLSHFSRAVRQRYGATPSDIREAARAGAAHRE
jgi:AraC-like DNA-binding protein